MPAIEIAIPPRSVYVAVVRLAVASLARGAGLDEDRVDDLRIAVSEACTNAVLAHEEAGSQDEVVVRWADEDDRLVVDVKGLIEPPSEAIEDSHGFSTRSVLSQALLDSLVDESEIFTEDGVTISRLILRR